jgi:hypothetical protein
LSREVIEQDLSITKSVQETCERILQGLVGGQPMGEEPVQTQPAVEGVAQTSKTQIQQIPQIDPTEPLQIWCENKQDRQLNLQKRKLKMLLESRKKFENKS